MARYQRDESTSHGTVYQMVTDKVLEALNRGTVPWHQPWKVAGNGIAFPLSMSTGRPYRGINLFLLGFSEYSSPWWGTYDRCAELAGLVKNARGKWESPDDKPRGVRRGEKSTLVVFWARVKVESTHPDTGLPESHWVPMLRYYRVFNAEQVDGLPEKYRAASTDALAGTFAEHHDAEQILKTYLATENAPGLVYGGDQAFWTVAYDTIHLPVREAYESAAEFYSTAFHECSHSTGHPSRLNREECVKYDEHNRPREEMCAEMTSAMLLAVAGIDDLGAFSNSASYVNGWRKRLSDDPKLVVLAAARAQHAADYILGVKYEDHVEAEA